MELKNCSSWCLNDLFSLKIEGDKDYMMRVIATLEVEFNEPKFGYQLENWDEE